MFQASRFVGPMIAGVLIAWAGVFAAFAAHAIGTLFFSLVMHLIRMNAPPRHGGRRNMFADISESVSFVRSHKGIWPLFMMLTLASVCLRPLQEMLPGFADVVFNSGAMGLAWLTSGVGLGAMISALRVAMHGRSSGMTNMCFTGLAGLSASTLGFVATDSLWAGVFFAALTGYTLNTLSTSVQALVQLSVEDHMRARVMSLYTLIFRGTPAIGALAFGVLAEYTGLRWSYALAAIVCLAGAALLWPSRSVIARAIEHAPGTSAPQRAGADSSVDQKTQ
ncbi:MAG: MFS transporter [Alphaproteobacteria bacterium]|nr:MFS transporter [Alphaproteobacteria bacterium]